MVLDYQCGKLLMKQLLCVFLSQITSKTSDDLWIVAQLSF